MSGWVLLWLESDAGGGSSLEAWRTGGLAEQRTAPESISSLFWQGGNPLLAEESSKITPCSGTQLIAMLRESLESFQIVDLCLCPSAMQKRALIEIYTASGTKFKTLIMR